WGRALGVAAGLLGVTLSCSRPESQEAPPGFRRFIDGLSGHHMPITASPLAQKYFDQGIRLVYAFNHAEAIRAFEAAQKLDADCAMCYWGAALALGPNINAPMEADAVKPALEAVAQAQARAGKATPREQAYVAAIATRYSDQPDADRAALDKSYSDAMRSVARDYPDDLDAATLFAESLMDLTPWAYWRKNGDQAEYTGEILIT